MDGYGRGSRPNRSFPKFKEGDFVLVALDDFTAGGQLSLRFPAPRPVIRAFKYYVFQLKYLLNRSANEVPRTHVQFYNDSSLDH